MVVPRIALKWFDKKEEVFYGASYWSPIITSKNSSENLSNQKNSFDDNKKIVHFGILIHVLSWRQQKLEKTVQKYKCLLWLLRVSDEFFDVIIGDQ